MKTSVNHSSGPYSSEAEHQSRKLGVVSSILTGGILLRLFFYLIGPFA